MIALSFHSNRLRRTGFYLEHSTGDSIILNWSTVLQEQNTHSNSSAFLSPTIQQVDRIQESMTDQKPIQLYGRPSTQIRLEVEKRAAFHDCLENIRLRCTHFDLQVYLVDSLQVYCTLPVGRWAYCRSSSHLAKFF